VGGKPCTITGQNVTTINATTPMDASIAGSDVEVALTLANGVSVTDAINVTFPVFCFVLEFKNDIKAGELLTATVTNSDKLTGVEIDNEAVQYILQGSTLYVSVPGNASGAAELKLISSDGNASYTINIIGTGPVETVISTDVVDLGSWANTLLIPATNVAVRPGTRVKIYYTSTAANPQFKIMTGNWAAQTIDDPNYDAQWSVVGVSETGSISSSWSFVLDETILAAFASDGGMLISGQNIIISKVSVVSGGTSEVLWEGSTATGSWSGNVTLNASAFASAAAGNRIIVTCADVEGGAQWGIRDGNWSNIVEYADIFGYRYEYTIDAAGLAALQATGGIFTGHDYTIIKIELKNY
jgi:hypothetical protein